MKKYLIAIAITILTSLYVFPFETVWLPAVNTKLALATFAPILLIMQGARMRNARVDSSLFILSVVSLFVSFFGIISVVINNTHDYTYASYFVKMWVWLGGAYMVIKAIELAYGKVTVRLVGNFLIAVAVAQCLLSQIINSNEAFSNFVDSFMVSTGFMGKHESRLYGIGCALDVAGIKFCAILIINAFLCATPISKEKPHIERGIYMLAFFIVGVLGSMISRTTSIGIILGLLLWLLLLIKNNNNTKEYSNVVETFKTLGIFIILLLPIIIYLYNTDPTFYANLRFGFEGFFSLVEKGSWDVRSNEQMLSMVIWPDNFKTWLIGDGYFENPMNDYYYIGPAYHYYMGTDVGYCRFIFYFGLLGLIAFSCVFIASTIICSRNNPKYAIVFWFMLLMNFIVWIKVSSDLFSVFALFLFVQEKNECYNSNKIVE